VDIKKLDNPVFIIDGSSFLYRAYYSIRPLSTQDGTPVNAVYGFCRMIKKLIDTYEPQYMALVWDSKGKTVRHELYENYKHARQAPPSDLIQQKEIIGEFAHMIGLTQLQVVGIEADDLMHSLAYELSQEQYSSVLVTSDKDMGQALSEYVTILDPFKELFINQQSLEEKLGFKVSKLPFYYALVGDASDNIPGVRGIGPKGAQQLVQQFNSLEELYDRLDLVRSERTKELLLASHDNAFLSEQLFILRFYQTHLKRQDCIFKNLSWQKARPLFQRLAFKSLLSTMPVDQEQAIQVTTPHYPADRYSFITVTTKQQLEQLCLEIKKYNRIALDTEGTSLRPIKGQMVGLSICVNQGVAYYIPFGHITGHVQLERDYVFGQLRPILEDQSIEKYLHNAKFDTLMLNAEGIELKGIVFDTIIAASLLVTDGQKLGLKYLSEHHLQEPMLHWADVVKKHKYPNFSHVPLELATNYAAADAHQTMKLYSLFKERIDQHNLNDLFYKLEMPFMNILYGMEKEGISLNNQVLHQINMRVSDELALLHQEIIQTIGTEHADINLNSPKQLEELLFIHLRLPAVKKTTSRTAYSTDHEVLTQLAKIHAVPKLIMRYRELFKLKSTYLDALSGYIRPDTGRVHTSFNQTAVATGRLSSSEPNLQNIPVDRFGIRSAFHAPEGALFLSVDYSQIELRILAYLSQDPVLIAAFNNKQDIHALTAAGLFDVAVEQVTTEQRQLGKRINFSILYGLTPHGLAKDLDISHKLAKSYIEKYMAQYPGVVRWMDSVVEQTTQKGYVETFWGRRRLMPGIYEKNKTLYDLARRVAINTVPQGTAAELMKWGMLHLDKALRDNGLKAKIILQIHDELLLEVPEQEIEQTEKLTQNVLQNIVTWNIPLIVTTRIGKNWQEVTK
jgi:DNA polymerase I